MNEKRRESMDDKIRIMPGNMVPESPTPVANIKVVGVGGAGGNAVLRMMNKGLEGVEFIAINTDRQDLEKSPAPTRLCIGEALTSGQGTGGDPDTGERAAMEDDQKIAEALDGADLVFVAAGMGGGTGTGAAPVVADIASRTGALVVSVVTLPATLEGARRRRNATRGIKALQKFSNTLIPVPNDKVFGMDPEMTLEDAFHMADDLLRFGVQGISSLITHVGRINLDFQDVRAVLSSGCRATMGIGEAAGPNRVEDAMNMALGHPLNENLLPESPQAVLLNITTSPEFDVKLKETNHAIQRVGNEEGDMFWGTTQDAQLGETLRITLIAVSPEEATAVQEKSLREAVPMGSAPLPPEQPQMFRREPINPVPSSPFSGNDRRWDELQTPPLSRKDPDRDRG